MRKLLPMLCLFLFSSTAYGTTIYVDGNLGGNCTGNYSIANRACNGADGDAYTAANLQSALNALGALTASATHNVKMRAGTYSVSPTLSRGASVLNGTSAFYKIISAHSGETVTLTGTWDLNNLSFWQLGDLSGNGLRWVNQTATQHQAVRVENNTSTNNVSCSVMDPKTGNALTLTVASCGWNFYGNVIQWLIPTTTTRFTYPVKFGQQGGSETGIMADVSVRNNTITNSFGFATFTDYTQYSEMVNNTMDLSGVTFPPTSQTGGFGIAVRATLCTGSQSHHNYFAHNVAANVDNGGSNDRAFWTDSSCNNNVVEYNYAYNINTFGFHLEAGACGTIMRYNVVHGTGRGLAWMDPTITQGCANTVHNNTFHDNAVGMCHEGAIAGTVFRDNVMSSSSLANVSMASFYESNITYNDNLFPTGAGNLFYRNTSVQNIVCGTTANTSYTNFFAAVPDDGNNQQGTAAYVSTTHTSVTSLANFNLTAASAGVGTASDGNDKGAYPGLALNTGSCKVENASPNRMDCDWDVSKGPISSCTAASITVTVAGGGRTTTQCDITGGSQIRATFNGAAVTAGQALTAAFSAGALKDSHEVGKQGFGVKGQNKAISGFTVTNNVGGGSTSVVTQTYCQCEGADEEERITLLGTSVGACTIAASGRSKIRIRLQLENETQAINSRGFSLEANDGSGAYVVADRVAVGDCGSRRICYATDAVLTPLAATTVSLPLDGDTADANCGRVYALGAHAFPICTASTGKRFEFLAVVGLDADVTAGQTVTGLKMRYDDGTALAGATNTCTLTVVPARGEF